MIMDGVTESSVNLSVCYADTAGLPKKIAWRNSLSALASFAVGLLLPVAVIYLDSPIAVGIVGFISPPVLFYSLTKDQKATVLVGTAGAAGCLAGTLGCIALIWGGYI